MIAAGDGHNALLVDQPLAPGDAALWQAFAVNDDQFDSSAQKATAGIYLVGGDNHGIAHCLSADHRTRCGKGNQRTDANSLLGIRLIRFNDCRLFCFLSCRIFLG